MHGIVAAAADGDNRKYTQYTFFSVYLKLSRNKNKIHGFHPFDCNVKLDDIVWHNPGDTTSTESHQVLTFGDIQRMNFAFQCVRWLLIFFANRFAWYITFFFCIVRFIFDICFRRHIDRSPFIYWHESTFVVYLDFRVSIYNSYGSSQWYFIYVLFITVRD